MLTTTRERVSSRVETSHLRTRRLLVSLKFWSITKTFPGLRRRGARVARALLADGLNVRSYRCILGDWASEPMKVRRLSTMLVRHLRGRESANVLVTWWMRLRREREFRRDPGRAATLRLLDISCHLSGVEGWEEAATSYEFTWRYGLTRDGRQRLSGEKCCYWHGLSETRHGCRPDQNPGLHRQPRRRERARRVFCIRTTLGFDRDRILKLALQKHSRCWYVNEK